MKSVVLFFVLVLSLQVQAQNPLKVHYLPPVDEINLIKKYNLAILQLALEKTKDSHGDYEIIQEQEANFTQQDALKFLKERKELYVVPTMTDAVRERIFIPVRVPLYKGLFGIRMMMVSEKEKFRLTQLTPVQLKHENFVQGAEWPDTKILKANGINVVEYSKKTDMVQSLKEGKATLYPRSIVEIWDELTILKNENLAALESVYLYYPTAMYYFIQRSVEGKLLAERLEIGLQRAIEDGSFDKKFKELLGPILKKSGLDEKQIIRLENPLLTEQTPLDKKEYWFVEEEN